jgi:hypothetical protein
MYRGCRKEKKSSWFSTAIAQLPVNQFASHQGRRNPFVALVTHKFSCFSPPF